MMHSCSICANEFVDADAIETNYLVSTKQWICDSCLDDDPNLRLDIECSRGAALPEEP